MKKIIYFILLFATINACRPKQPIECEESNVKILKNDNYKKEDPKNYGYYFLNEGGFTYGNASISAWNGLTNTVTNNIFKKENSYNIGDVLQSVYLRKTNFYTHLYLIVNNSQKIEVVDKANFLRVETITGFTSPRYMTIAKGNAYVTDLYANEISVFSTIYNNCAYESIKMKGWTEQIFTINDKLYVIERSEVGASSLFANLVEIEILENENNKARHSILSRTPLSIEPQSVVVDSEKNIWILSSGKESENVYPTLTKFNTSTNSIEKSFTYNSFSNIPQNIAIGSDLMGGNIIFYNRASKIYKISTDATEFSDSSFINTPAQNIYNVMYNDHIGKIYVFDAKDYVSKGDVYIYDISGVLVKKFEAGVIPSKLVF